ncbi:hypothetical protein [Legionella shakespearei]|uniref:F-box domain-containing protein n=1 Tax=Legionella shakespearei DSM 23087 TaxID=1122169 RepID=A0A0W0YW03_9GAMM|nr:hypothetical protein [Legionella shakespearei]KTD60830.1 hypothetical protein Lsha_1547 [Legionella shakespearei DSM 23087]
MTSFFSLPQDVLTQIYLKLPPETLLRMVTTGSVTAKNETVIRSLFMKRDNEAKRYQEKVIQSWDQAHGAYPFPFAGRHNEFCRALARLGVRHQIMGLYLMNKPGHGLQADHSQAQSPRNENNLPLHHAATATVQTKPISTEAELTAHISWISFNLINRNSKARRALIKLAKEIDDRYLPLLLALIQKKLESQPQNEYIKQYNAVTKALALIAPRLESSHLTLLLTWIQQELESLYESDDEDDDTMDEEIVVHRGSWYEDFHYIHDSLDIITPWFQEEHLTNFLGWIQKKMTYEDIDIDVQKALTTLAIRLPNAHLATFFTWIQINIAHWNAAVQINAHEALAAVASRLDAQSIPLSLIDSIKDHLNNENDSLRLSAQRTLTALAPKLNEQHIATLLTWVQDNLNLGDNEVRNALQILAAIGSHLDGKLITATFFGQVQASLRHSNFNVRTSAQQALTALAPRLNGEFITAELTDTIRSNLELDHSSVTISALEALEALAPRLKAVHLSPTLLSLIQDNLLNPEYLFKNGSKDTLMALMPILNDQQIDGFLDWIQNILELDDDRMKADALQALTIIVSGLNTRGVSSRLITLIQSNLLKENHLAFHAQEVLVPLTPRLDDPDFVQFFDWMENNLGQELKPEPYLGNLLIYCPVDDTHAIPIAKKLVDIINGEDKYESEMALNLLGQWSMSWIQYVDSTNKDALQDLIASLQPDVHNKSKQYAPDKTWNMLARLSDHNINPNPYLLSLLREQLQQFVDTLAVTLTAPAP